jgi:hypothetical protein
MVPVKGGLHNRLLSFDRDLEDFGSTIVSSSCLENPGFPRRLVAQPIGLGITNEFLFNRVQGKFPLQLPGQFRGETRPMRVKHNVLVANRPGA